VIEKLLKLFRIAIPSWRFFDELGEISHLYYRFGEKSSELGSWILYSRKPIRNIRTLFFNCEENLFLANIGLISDLPASARLVENLVCWEIARTYRGKFFFQFKSSDFLSPIRESTSS
jgi:hypothetical protein